jgi:hypothetical protein
MNQVALEKARSRLRSAIRAVEALRAAEGDDEIHDHWLDFLIAWKGVYSKVQQAAKETPQELQWFGAVNKERKADPLLRYLFEARNDEEHGLVYSVQRDLGVYAFRVPEFTGHLKFGMDDDGNPCMVDAEGKKISELTHKDGGEISLHAVSERDSKKKVPPPTSHFDEPIEPKPIPVAQAGLRWIAALVATAEAIHTP